MQFIENNFAHILKKKTIGTLSFIYFLYDTDIFFEKMFISFKPNTHVISEGEYKHRVLYVSFINKVKYRLFNELQYHKYEMTDGLFYLNFVNKINDVFFRRNWVLTNYIYMLYVTYNSNYIYNYSYNLQKLLLFKSIYEYVFLFTYTDHPIKYRCFFWPVISRYVNPVFSGKNTLKGYLRDYLPILNLLVVITVCFLLRNRNLFLLLKFYEKLFLFDTTGIDNGHTGRKKQSCQIKCLSNILWHLMFRERCNFLNLYFFNFKHNSLIFLTLVNHIKYIRRFKGKGFRILQLIILLKQQFGFMRGQKLAIRKRFVTRRGIAAELNLDKIEYNYRLKQQKKKKNVI